MAKILFRRLTKDIFQYAYQLENFQDYYQKFDLNDETMLRVMNLKLNKLSNLFFNTLSNHLSVKTNVRGIGEKVIKPIKQEYGTSTTVKYQNMCGGCCIHNDKNVTSKFIGLRDQLKVQTTINVTTYDNISLDKILHNNSVTGYQITVGKLSYLVNNFNSIDNLMKSVQLDEFELSEQNKITSSSIDILYDFIDKQIDILADMETILVVNIEFIDKCIIKFSSEL
jgi:hypothetical protein